MSGLAASEITAYEALLPLGLMRAPQDVPEPNEALRSLYDAIAAVNWRIRAERLRMEQSEPGTPYHNAAGARLRELEDERFRLWQRGKATIGEECTRLLAARERQVGAHLALAEAR
jgi:hypothetical protein